MLNKNSFALLLGFVSLVSAASTNSSITRIAYVWTGSNSSTTPDFLTTLSLTPGPTFLQIISTSPCPTAGNEPHHIGFNEDKTVLATGGLLSLLEGQPGIFLWDIKTDPLNPKFLKSVQSVKSAATDEIKPRVGGGFWITDMGAADGSSPGALLELLPDLTTFTEWPSSPPPTVNSTNGFNPHGFSIDTVNGNIITVDYVEPSSTLKSVSPGGPTLRETTRIWDLATRTITRTVTIPGAGGIMDTQHLNNDSLGRAVVTAVALGKLFLVNPADGSFTLAFDIGITNIGACYIAQKKDGSRLYVTLSNPNLLIILDSSDPTNMKRIDTNPSPLVGPHYIALTPDEKHVVVSDYFLQEGDAGWVNLPADYRVWVGDVQDDGDVVWPEGNFVDFKGKLNGGRPHGLAIRDI